MYQIRKTNFKWVESPRNTVVSCFTSQATSTYATSNLICPHAYVFILSYIIPMNQ